ncbi:MAG TPA: DUF1800 domain-containing protein [Pyrinomonadaceae bacterium]|nr:DUF1800 domain-containing protein [Pyrinomonadaceae bacterium]
MKSFKTFRRRGVAFLSALALVSNTLFVASAGAQRPEPRAARLTEDERIVHVLNRLGFGPRPGDVERVRRVGVERYIEEQLRPESIRDDAAEARLRDLTTLRMSNGELLAKFPNPGQLLRRMQRQGALPPELAAALEARLNNPNAPAPNATSAPGAMMNAPEDLMPADNSGASASNNANSPANATPNNAEGDGQRAEYRRAVLRYMRANGLEPPARVVAELQASRILRAVYSERQLQEVMVDFWSNHFNVFAGKGADRWLLTSFDRDAIRPNALGKFRDLLGATAKSPAMLFYLDNFQSVSPNAPRAGRRRLFEMLNPGAQDEARGRMNHRRDTRARRRQQRQAAQTPGEMRAPEGQEMARQPQRPPQQRRRRGINENYARELMELHTLGVEGGYTQKDVQEVARAFTGWTILDPRGALMGEQAGRFVFNPRAHDDGEKTVLGQRIPAGGGQRDGEQVLDILARHPSTAKFIATKLARRFVADDPSPALVARVASAFTKSDGDIRETLRALFATPEFNSSAAPRAKIKTRFEFSGSALRATGAETNGGPRLHQWVARMGEPLYMYQAPTGYPDRAEHWVNTGALLERLNFTLALAGNRIPGTRVELSRFLGDAPAAGRERLIDQFLRQFLQADVTPKTREVLMKQLSEPATNNAAAANGTQADEEPDGERDATRARRGRLRQARASEPAPAAIPEAARIAALILGSPEFQRQ